VPELPVASSKGIRREFVAPSKDFKYQTEKNDVKMSFTLNKGCYATSLLREFMKGDVLSY
jgi:tRNA pseudouridine13 synthase